ncbi:hypothetical protein NTGZN8_240016 [Candidatus Nitrotoga fabula]|uniref:Uncharacterized protein n=1 Tax=Candidatus Nitrotoga fabula TaxID=2182327 RepID=A0A916F8Y0_9PROT|nr:hypothetical protein NTGZN8_240016 [Candidatus Nitrotoga fabula]
MQQVWQNLNPCAGENAPGVVLNEYRDQKGMRGYSFQKKMGMMAAVCC